MSFVLLWEWLKQDDIRSSIFAVPNFTLPKFDLSAILIIVPVVLAVFMEHVGDITTNGQVVGKNFIEDPGLNRTILRRWVSNFCSSIDWRSSQYYLWRKYWCSCNN